MIDIGANLTNKAFRGDLPAVLDRASRAGVTKVVVTGTSVSESRAARDLAATEPALLRSTAGVHPHDARHFTEQTTAELRAIADSPEVVAIGECGLDFDRNYSPPDDQRRCFRAQVELACDLGMPLFVHDREAASEVVATLREFRDYYPGAVVHCFTGDADALAAYLDLDLHIGITGWVCDERRGNGLAAIVDRIPLDRLMIETDAPWLLPRNMPERPKSRRNEPAFLVWVRDKLAECYGIDASELGSRSEATARAFFGLS